jgi:tRNA nucleotidyltransferase (CCA-adding enzyme)
MTEEERRLLQQPEGEQYRYIHQDVWFKERDVWKIWVELNKISKAQTFHEPGPEMDKIRNRMRHLVKVICEVLFQGAMSGGEFANLYATHTHPFTKKKIDALLSE